jgi:hypothetical protein
MPQNATIDVHATNSAGIRRNFLSSSENFANKNRTNISRSITHVKTTTARVDPTLGSCGNENVNLDDQGRSSNDTDQTEGIFDVGNLLDRPVKNAD